MCAVCLCVGVCVCVCAHLGFCGAQCGAGERRHHDENNRAHKAVEQVEKVYSHSHGLLQEKGTGARA